MNTKYKSYWILIGFIFSNNIFSDPLGWYPKNIIDTSGIIGYSFSTGDIDNQKSIFITTAHLKTKWKENTANQILLKIHSFNGSKLFTREIKTIHVKPAEVLFPVHPSIGSFNNEVLIAWQETDLKTATTQIKYIYSSNNGATFTEEKVLDVDTQRYTTVLPLIKVDFKGRFHLFYQRETKKTKFTLERAIIEKGKVDTIDAIITNTGYIGYGTFFPSIILNNNIVDFIYQNRAGSNKKDDIFRLISSNTGNSYSSPIQITNSSEHDFSPNILRLNNNLEWVWQGRENNIWSIFYSKDEPNFEPIKITPNTTNSYSPYIGYTKSMGRILLWHDFSETPSQVFSLFLDQKNKNNKVGINHNVSLEKSAVEQVKMLHWKNKIWAFYITGGNLIAKLADSFAEKPKISSLTHIEHKPSKNPKSIFNFTYPNDPSGIDEVAWVQDNKPETIPEVYNIPTNQKTLTINNLTGGNYYLHVRSKDRVGNESDTAHYHFIIDSLKPSPPVINSTTHANNIPSTLTEAKISLSADDDSGIQEYRYVISKNRAAILNEVTKENNLTLTNLPLGISFFKVQALDFAGNLSKITTYKLEIISQEDKLPFFNNIIAEQLKEDNLKITFTPIPGYKIKKVFYIVDDKEREPFVDDAKIATIVTNSTKQTITIPMNSYTKNRLYSVSIGFEFQDKLRIKPKYYNFEYVDTSVPKKEIVKEFNLKKDFLDTISDITQSKDAIYVETPKTFGKQVQIKYNPIDIEASFFEISFDIPKEYKNWLEGYVWQLTTEPEIPKSTIINSKGSPEYISDLEDGIWYLSVKPIFKEKDLNKDIKYSYIRITIDHSWSIKTKLMIISFIFILILIYCIYKRKQIEFYLSRYLK